MRSTLFLDKEELVYQAPPTAKTGSVRYASSFRVRLAEIKIIGYVPRIIVDDESDFLVLITATSSLHYFNLDVADKVAVEELKSIFNIKLNELPSIPFDETNWHSFVVYPQELTQQPLFKPWSWFTLRGFLKNLGKSLGSDNPMWERLTNETQAYLAKNF